MSYEEIICPYCEHAYDLNHDDGAFYTDGGSEKEECPQCEKSFLVESSVSWSFDAVIAECLNDGNHKWKKEYNEMNIKNYPPLAEREACDVCGEKRRVVLESSLATQPSVEEQQIAKATKNR